MLAIISEKQSVYTDIEHDADTPNGLAGLSLCTDSSEPQYTSVIVTVIVDVSPADDEQTVRVPNTGEQVKRRAQAG